LLTFLGDHKKNHIGEIVAEKIRPFLGVNVRLHSAVTDGGEFASIKHTAEALPTENKFMGNLEGHLCVCHQLNNAIKSTLTHYLGRSYLPQWREFISRLNYSNNFRELFLDCKRREFPNSEKKTVLQKDCDTRYSFLYYLFYSLILLLIYLKIYKSYFYIY
jgi:hypothetical protein